MSTLCFTRRASVFVVALLTIGCASLSHSGSTGPRVTHHAESYWSGKQGITVDHYSTGTGGQHPAMILLHGSGGLWFTGGHAVRHYARALAARGFETFVVHYFDATGTLFAGSASERRNFARWVGALSDAVTYVARQPAVDASRIGVLGVSLGAYLAVGVAAEDRRVTALVDISGGLEPFLADRVTRLPPALILHGSHDKVVPVAEAFLLARYLSLRDMHYEMRIYQGEGHQFADTTEADAVERASEFFFKATSESR
jgi:dienelactone hydrolase